MFVCLFIYLFVWSFSPYSNIFHSFGDVTNASEGLQILTYARHLLPLRSEGSLECHTYCDTGHPFIMVINLRGLVTLTPVADHLAVELSQPILTTSVHHNWNSNTQPSTCRTTALTHCATAAVNTFNSC